ncbi:phage tail sheath subtilisin-like domain-containing protein [Clostridium estertheticum]|uniref:phage tail sheath subtilisin-like domain-containing protein n=1 Tax=Clostridium estertheticum TaxID=238834 RepID=UPI00124CBE7C|nr:phage tail sheath subtilisin-like domain-containing protein [Clostridium estertheticum]MBZ9615296.1 phage tail sheath subtilisin-like domain-containing protein [Clostridium estertheticum subsp. laramiense]WAG75185.1 phage tail sheath subtilisin-like domain-containing protein [Clostridium estertheticum]
MGLPDIRIIFKQAGITAAKRGQRGIVALILKDATHNGLITMNSNTDIPKELSTYNKDQLNKAWLGGVNSPLKVIAFIEPIASTDYSEAMGVLESTKWNYLAIPGIISADNAIIGTWIKGLKDNMDIRIKVVLPHYPGDHECVINYDTDDLTVGEVIYDATDYCARIAGLLAGTPLDMSATYQVLPEVTDVPHLSITAFNTAINAGKLVLINDGEKVKVARAVNSLVTTTADKGTDYKKIKLVDIMDQIHDDLKKTTADNYTGKLPNNYDNKCILIIAYKAYLESLENDSLLDKGKTTIGIDIESTSVYLKSVGIDISLFTEQDIKSANTAEKVFISGNTKILDAMEDFNLNLGI